MADRKCSLCGEPYTDEEGHDYSGCVARLRLRLAEARDWVLFLERAFVEAQRLAALQAKGDIPHARRG